MARTGRPRKPTHLKLIEGTHRKDRANPQEPRTAPGTPSCPPELGAVAKAEWRRIIPELRAMQILTKADRATIAAYCQAYARWFECEKVVTEQGMTFMTDKGYVCQRPEVTLALKWSQRMTDLAGKLGLHPQGRAGVKVPEKAKKADTTAEFLFGNGSRTARPA